MSTPNRELGATRSAALDSPWRNRWRRFRTIAANAFDDLYRSKTAFAGAIMLLVLFTACAAAPLLTKYDPIKTNYRVRLAPPSAEHIFGTDRYGRDVFSRILWAGRRLLVIAICAVGFGLLLGIPLGVFSGHFGGWFDNASMRLVDAMLAFPGILLFLLFVTLAHEYKLSGSGLDAVLVFALGLAFMPETARLTRGVAIAESQKEYVEASAVLGNSGMYTALREILPNCLSPLLVHATVLLGLVILIVAALSYLGLGTAPPTPDWGADLRAAQDHMETRPLIAIFPGLAIFYTVLAFNLVGDGLRDVLDPRTADR
ncbi:MAG: ABC transporter permease [Pseudomonadota bacterium]